MDTVALKKEAKEKLRGNYIEIVSAMILIAAIVILILAISNILQDAFLMSFVGLILSGFMLMGFITMVMKVAKGEQTNLEDLFCKIHLFLKSTVLTISMIIIIGVFVFFLGVSLYGLYTSSGLWGICNPWIVNALICIGIVLSMALLVFTAYVSLSFSQVYFIFYDNPDMSIYEILKKSYYMMDGHKLELFILLISFLGWILLGILTFGVLYLWLIPYMLISMANFYNELAHKKKKRGRPKASKTSKTKKKVD